MMDISDGLLLDAARMARASGVTMAVKRRAVPIAAPEEQRELALRWGEDYVLLFTVPASTKLPVPHTGSAQCKPAQGLRSCSTGCH